MNSNSEHSLATLLKRIISFQAIGLVGIVLLGIIFFVFDISLNLPAKLASLVGAIMLITVSHLWISDLRTQVGRGVEQFMLCILAVGAVSSFVLVALLLFDIGPMNKLIVTLFALQLIHLILYGVQWFFFEEREIVSHKSPTAMEIAAMDINQSTLPPSRQSSE